MDKLIYKKAKTVRQLQKDYLKLQAKHPQTLKGKQQVSTAKRDFELANRDLMELEDIRDEKVPMIEKLKETCDSTPYFKLQSSNMQQAQLRETVKETKDQFELIKKAILDNFMTI